MAESFLKASDDVADGAPRAAWDGPVVIFYKDFERDSFFKYDRYLKRIVRPLYNAVTTRPKVSGFLVWYRLLVRALRGSGFEVRENDYAFARKHPNHPIGLSGYPAILDRWSLPNPVILGPGLFDHPGQRPDLMSDPRFKKYIVTCDWMHSLFGRVYGNRCVSWHAGIDVDRWSDTESAPKTNDFLIYDKIRWNRDRLERELLEPIRSALADRGLRHETIRYGKYDYAVYAKSLARSRAMIFLCEHETQGMAYQECLASNVPILAWNNGRWLDPMWSRYESEPPPASSVPYFSPECGETFAGIESFNAALETFLQRLPAYRPREYVKRELSFRESAMIYARHYAAIAA